MSERIACAECGDALTDEERHYYGHRCGQCEIEWSDRIEAWRHGAEDADLSALYDGAKPAAH